jgi:hypothetical protein
VSREAATRNFESPHLAGVLCPIKE